MTIFELAPTPAYDLAPTISVVDGEVVVVGPGAVAFSMTRGAAEETYRRLGQALKDREGGGAAYVALSGRVRVNRAPPGLSAFNVPPS